MEFQSTNNKQELVWYVRYYSRKEQPYQYHDYSLFLAEVASTTNEILLINYLIDNADDKATYCILIYINNNLFAEHIINDMEYTMNDKKGL